MLMMAFLSPAEQAGVLCWEWGGVAERGPLFLPGTWCDRSLILEESF